MDFEKLKGQQISDISCKITKDNGSQTPVNKLNITDFGKEQCEAQQLLAISNNCLSFMYSWKMQALGLRHDGT